MSDDRKPVGVSRRELLAAAGTIGTVGALSGMGTTALLTDVERFTGSTLRAGMLDLELDCDGDCDVDSDGTIQFDFPDLEPGDSGTQELVLTQTGNPAWVWLGSTCPVDDLEEAIDVRVRFDRGCDGSTEYRNSGTLREALYELATGVLLTDPCFKGGETGCLTFDWTFRYEEGVEAYVGETLQFELQLFDLQCRHTDGTENPYADRECDDIEYKPVDGRGISHITIWADLDEGCTEIGKIELDPKYAACSGTGSAQSGIGDNVIEEGLYDLFSDDDCVDSGYDVLVTNTETNEEGETTAIDFSLLNEDGEAGPDLCKVELKSGPGDGVVYEHEDLEDNTTGGLLEGPSK